MIRSLAVLLVLALQQPPTPQQLREQLETLARSLQLLIDQLPKVQPITTAAQLQAALNEGGTIELPAGSTFAGSFRFSKSGTVLLGHGATVTATSGPAVYIPPGVSRVEIRDLVATSGGKDAVIQCGDNGPTQTTLAQQPTAIAFYNVNVPTHRGKRAFELNCAATLTMSSASDVWHPDKLDSQGVWVGNSCGPVAVTGGTFVAASENIMIGGDTLKIKDCPDGVPADLIFDGVTLSKPESWRTDGVVRGVKNLFEVKAGKRVRLLRSTLSGTWAAGQDGWAILLTPKNGQYVETVEIDGVTVDRAAGGVQFLGRDYNSVTPQATRDVTVRNSRFTLSKATYGGRGILALYTAGMLDSLWENVTATFDGNAILQCDTSAGNPAGPFTMRSSRLMTGTYGVMAPGVNYGGATPAAYAGRECRTVFEGNTFADAPARFKTNFPGNTWTTRAELDVLLSK